MRHRAFNPVFQSLVRETFCYEKWNLDTKPATIPITYILPCLQDVLGQWCQRTCGSSHPMFGLIWGPHQNHTRKGSLCPNSSWTARNSRLDSPESYEKKIHEITTKGILLYSEICLATKTGRVKYSHFCFYPYEVKETMSEAENTDM